MTLTIHQHPGKFEDELALAPLAYDMALDGSGEEYDFGNEDYADHYTVCSGGIDLSPSEIADLGLTADDVAFANNLLGFIVHEDNQGFVAVTWYEKGEEVRMAEAVGKLRMGEFEREQAEIDD